MEIKEIDLYVVSAFGEQGVYGSVKYFKDKELAEKYSKTERYFKTQIDVKRYYISDNEEIFMKFNYPLSDNEWKEIFEKYSSIKSKLTEEELKFLKLI